MMKRSCRVLVVMGLATWAGGCSTLSAVFNRGENKGLEEVDGLLGNVERAHLECELSRTKSAAALDALHSVVAPDFRGDAIAAYGQLQVVLEQSVEQAASLRATVRPLREAAESVSADWEADLGSFQTEMMRAKSRARLGQITEEYVSVHRPLVAACDAYDLFNLGLSEHLLYLGNDLNAQAVGAIEDELVMLTGLQVQLDARLEVCIQAASNYVNGNALNGQVDPTPIEPRVAVRQAANSVGIASPN